MLILIRFPFHPLCYRSGTYKTPVIHSAKSAGGRLHLNTHTPLTQRNRSGLTMPSSRHSVGTYPVTSSHATCQETFGYSRIQPAEPLWTDPGIKSGISVHELISTKKKKKKRRREMNCRNFPQILAREEKATATTNCQVMSAELLLGDCSKRFQQASF